MKFLLEKEVFLRSIKHVFNKYIRESESEELVSQLIIHLFNCIFAPKDFIKKLDEGAIKLSPVTIKKLAE
jgi:predicted helicase